MVTRVSIVSAHTIVVKCASEQKVMGPNIAAVNSKKSRQFTARCRMWLDVRAEKVAHLKCFDP